MADQRISELDDAGPITGTEVSEMVQGGDNKKVSETVKRTYYQTGVELTANKGAANGYAPLDSSSKVPSANLPSYVDDVEEYANFAALPVTGETGKIYVTLDDNKAFRWSGSAYVEISSVSLASETVSGISEEATDAEVTAGTAAGGTGSRLFLNPAKLLTWWTAIKAAAITFGSSLKAKQIAGDYGVLTDAANIAWNANTIGNIGQVTLGGNRTLDAITNPQTGGLYILRVVQDGTGSRTLAFNAAYTFPNSISPILNSAIAAVTVFAFFYDGTNFRYILPNGSYRFLDAYLESQKAASTKKNLLYIDDTGKLNKVSWIEFDTTNNKMTLTGVNDSSGTTTFEVVNQSLNSILKVLNGRAIEIGGTTFAIIVDTGIASGSAYLELNSNQNQPFKVLDKAGNVFEEIRSTTGDLAKKINQPLELDQLTGNAKNIFKQFQATVAVSAGGTTTIGFVDLIAEEFVDVHTQWIVAESAGTGGGCNINGTANRTSGGTVALVGAQDKGAGERRVGAGTWLCDLIGDDTNKRINFRFTNNTGTGLAFKVTVNVWYTKTLEPA